MPDRRQEIAQSNNAQQQKAWEREAHELVAGKRFHTYSQDKRVWQLLALALAEITRLRSK